MNRRMVKRVEVLEKRVPEYQHRLRAVVKIDDVFFIDENSKKLDENEFKEWVKQLDHQGKSSLIILELDVDSSINYEKQEIVIKVRVDNALRYNLNDLLRLQEILKNTEKKMEERTGKCNRCGQKLPKYAERGGKN